MSGSDAGGFEGGGRLAGHGMMPARGMEVKAATVAPRCTVEETILLRALASGNTAKEMAMQMRLPRASLYPLMGDLRRKTGASSDTALAVWALRTKGSGGEVRRAADSEPATPTLRKQTRRKGRGLRGGSEIGILLAEEPRIWRVCRRSRRRSCRRYRLCR
jgi:DNA-binding CsgD family transcriptional regulator